MSPGSAPATSASSTARGPRRVGQRPAQGGAQRRGVGLGRPDAALRQPVEVVRRMLGGGGQEVARVHRATLSPGRPRVWARAASRIAAHERSTSPVVVAQLQTEMRMARRPRHVVGPIQQLPSSLDGGDHGVGIASSSPKRDEHLVEDDVVEDLDSVAARRALREAPRARQQRSTNSATPSRPSERRAA